MDDIRLLTEKHVKAMARLMRNAYPGYDISEEAQQNTEKWVRRVVAGTDDEIGLGCFDEQEQLVGGMQVLNQPMNLRMKMVNVIGLGGLCVDLLHKKKRIALNLLYHSFMKGQKEGACMAILDPFNIGFYKKMGCGISVKNHQFKLKPSQMPHDGHRSMVHELKEEDIPIIVEYVHRYYLKHHGMLKMEEYEIRDILQECQMILGVSQKGELSGIMPIRFERTAPHNIFKTNLIVEEFLYDDPVTAKAFFSFLNAQADQATQVIINSQDNHFESNFQDPDTGDDDTFHTRSNEMYRTGNGMMARILNMEKVFAAVEVPAHETRYFPMTIHIDDPLMEELTGEYTLCVMDGQLSAAMTKGQTEYDGSVEIGDLASLIMGAVNMNSLMRYGRVTINNADKMEALGRVLQYPQAPVCLSRF